MGLRRLAGPFVMMDGFTGTAVAAGTNTAAYPCAWVPSCGLMIKINGYINRVLLDGVAQNLCLVLAPGVPIDTWGFDDALQMLLQSSSGVMYAREKIAMCPYLVTPGYPIPANGATFYDVSNRRIIAAPTGGTMGTLYSATVNGAFVKETAIGYTGPVTFSKGRVNGEIFVGWSDASTHKLSGIFYQTRTKAVTSSIFHLGVTGAAVVYAKEYGVIVSVGTDFSVGVWSLEVLPTSLSAPISIYDQNGMTVYSVQLQGADGDGAAGEFVEWSLTGMGILIDTQTTTDQNGYATCRVVYEPALDPGSSTVTAEVLC